MQTKDIVDALDLFLSSLLLGQIDGPAADKLGLPAGSNAFHVDHDFFDSRQRDESDHLRAGTSLPQCFQGIASATSSNTSETSSNPQENKHSDFDRMNLSEPRDVVQCFAVHDLIELT